MAVGPALPWGRVRAREAWAALAVPLGVSWRVAKLFHIADKPELHWMWYLLAAFCAWSFWLILQLFLRSGTDGANGYEGRETGNLDIQ